LFDVITRKTQKGSKMSNWQLESFPVDVIKELDEKWSSGKFIMRKKRRGRWHVSLRISGKVHMIVVSFVDADDGKEEFWYCIVPW